jgi:general stress protein CsbA
MCFSANVSFIAGVTVSAIGIVTLKKVQAPSQIVFASIPLIFGIQQLSEGVLWLTIPDPAYNGVQQVATFTFLFFARVVWPVWVPLGVFLLEHEGKRKKLQKIIMLIGICVAVYFLFNLLLQPSQSIISGHHIFYQHDYPVSLKFYSNILYGLVTVLPLFISRYTRMWWLGAVIGISYIAAAYFFKNYAFSVWCFFAALISMSIYFIMNDITESHKRVSTYPTPGH